MALRKKSSADSLPPRRRRGGSETREPAEVSRQQRLFQRGRTLTGSVSSRVVSTAEHGADLKSPRVHAHHLANLRHRLGLVLVGVVLAGAGTLYLISEFTATVAISGPGVTLQHADAQKYSAIVDDYYARHPFERFRFALNHEQLRAYLQAQSPEVRTLSVGGTGAIAVSEVALSMRQPVASWVVDQEVLYVDSSGVAFASNFYDETKIVKIIDKSGVPTVNGKTLTSQRFLTFVGKLVGEAHGYGMEVEQAVLPRDTTRQVEVRLKGVAYPVKYSIDRLVGEQMEDMVRSVSYLKRKGVSPKYLDVRVKEKAYYK